MVWILNQQSKRSGSASLDRWLSPHWTGGSAAKEYSSGAWFELKDVVEVIIKLPAFIGISYLFQQDVDQLLENKILMNMIKKPQALGDWECYTKRMKNDKDIKKDIPTVWKLLKNVIKFSDAYKAVAWRNDMIGHGALPFEDSEEFIEIMCKLSQGIDKCMEESINIYENIKFAYTGGKLLVECDGEEWELDKCIFEEAFFFDRYNRKNRQVSSVKYEDGKRKDFKSDWYSKIIGKKEVIDEIERVSNTNIGQERTWQDIMNLQELNKPISYQANDKVMAWLTSCMENHEKGVFLFLMDRGMGKTAFVSSINQLLEGIKEGNWYTRAYYCSTLKYRSMDDFVTEFNSLLKMERNAANTIIETEVPALKRQDNSEKMAECLEIKLNNVREKEENEKLKLLFIIDGIDEIYVDGHKKNIYDFIPKSSELTEGVYILLTSRNGESEPLGEYTRNKIKELSGESIVDAFEFSLRNSEHQKNYREMLEKYFKRNCRDKKHRDKKHTDELSEEEKWFFEKMCELSKEKFVEFRIFALIYNEARRRGSDAKEIFINGNGLEIYFRFMKEQLGDKIYRMAGRILMIIATAEKALTIGDCIFLERLQENGNVVEIIAILKMFESLFIYTRENVGDINNNTVIRVVNEEYKKAIIEEFGDYLDELVGEWITFIESRYERMSLAKEKYDPNKDYDLSEIYLYASIYNYVMEKSQKLEYRERIHCREFADAIFQYEKGMPTKQLGLNVKKMDIAMSESCLKILGKIGLQNDLLYIGAFNNYMFHKMDEYFQTWGNQKGHQKALLERNEIESIYDKELENIKNMPDKTIDILEIYAKMCASKGYFLFKQNDHFNEVERLFEESYQTVKTILSQDMAAGCCIYIQAAERLLVILQKQGKKEEIEKKYQEMQKVIKRIKSSEEAKPYMLVNSRNRIEYGILPKEAMWYRKLASIFDGINWEPEGESIEGFYKRSLEMLKEIEEKELTDGQKRIIYDFKRKVYNEYGHYERNRQNNCEAIQLYTEAIKLTDELIDNNNLAVDKLVLEPYFYCLQLLENEKEASNENLQRYQSFYEHYSNYFVSMHECFCLQPLAEG